MVSKIFFTSLFIASTAMAGGKSEKLDTVCEQQVVDVVYDKLGRHDETFGVVESIKAVSDLFSPMIGKVVQANADLVADPAKINTDAHTEWMIVIEASDASAQFAALLDSDTYENFVKSI